MKINLQKSENLNVENQIQKKKKANQEKTENQAKKVKLKQHQLSCSEDKQAKIILKHISSAKRKNADLTNTILLPLKEESVEKARRNKKDHLDFTELCNTSTPDNSDCTLRWSRSISPDSIQNRTSESQLRNSNFSFSKSPISSWKIFRSSQPSADRDYSFSLKSLAKSNNFIGLPSPKISLNQTENLMPQNFQIKNLDLGCSSSWDNISNNFFDQSVSKEKYCFREERILLRRKTSIGTENSKERSLLEKKESENSCLSVKTFKSTESSGFFGDSISQKKSGTPSTSMKNTKNNQFVNS